MDAIRRLWRALKADRPLALPSIDWPEGLRALMLAPHPDDFDAIGIAMRDLHRRGCALTVAVARTGSGVEDVYQPGLTLEGMADLREEEQRRSLRFFGLPEDSLHFVRYANDDADQPTDSPENLARVHALFQQHAPDLVFLPHGADTNAGHRAIYSLYSQAARASDRTFVGMLIRDPKTVSSRVDLYAPFEHEDAAWKAELLRFHDSQHQRNLRTRGHGFDDRILQVNMAIARELGIAQPYAEGFEIERHGAP